MRQNKRGREANPYHHPMLQAASTECSDETLWYRLAWAQRTLEQYPHRSSFYVHAVKRAAERELARRRALQPA